MVGGIEMRSVGCKVVSATGAAVASVPGREAGVGVLFASVPASVPILGTMHVVNCLASKRASERTRDR